MSTQHKLSLPAAILINMNIMLGAGIFINTTILAHHAGALGFLAYAIVGVLMLPLILSIAQMVRLFPDGGFYAYGKNALSPLAGFISSWSYFTGKLASGALMIHVFAAFMQQLMPALQIVSTLVLDIAIICLFALLNMLNLRSGSRIQMVFMALKIVPITFAILSGIFLFSGANFAPDYFVWSGLPLSLPFVLYAFTGFEASCSLSSRIENAEHNAPRAILISYGVVVCIALLYQLIFFGNLGTLLAQQINYLEPFPALLHNLLPVSDVLRNKLIGLLHIAIASSSLGGGYGIMYSNNWNLYTLAQNKHTFFPKLFTKLNIHHIPAACVLVEAFLCITYLSATRGNNVPLQQIAALGCIISYSISVIALLALMRKGKRVKIRRWIPYFALISCALLTTTCINNFMVSGVRSLYGFAFLMAFGILMFSISTKNS